MRKIIIFVLLIAILFVAGCKDVSNSNVSSIDREFNYDTPIQVKEERNDENPKNINLIGSWAIYYAVDVSSGNEYPLQKLYGTGIKYGGNLVFFEDGSFSKNVGITDDVKACEGKYTVTNNKITLVFDNNRIDEAIYLESDNLIEYHTYDAYSKPVYEYYKLDK